MPAYQKASTPTFSLDEGSYQSAQTVAIYCATSEAWIRYTLDGSEPTEQSTAYSTPVQITETKTLKAKAFKSGWTESDTNTAEYTITP